MAAIYFVPFRIQEVESVAKKYLLVSGFCGRNQGRGARLEDEGRDAVVSRGSAAGLEQFSLGSHDRNSDSPLAERVADARCRQDGDDPWRWPRSVGALDFPWHGNGQAAD